MVLCRHWATPWCQISIAEGVLAVGHAPNVIGLYNLETGAKSAIKLDEVVPVVVFPVSDFHFHSPNEFLTVRLPRTLVYTLSNYFAMVRC